MRKRNQPTVEQFAATPETGVLNMAMNDTTDSIVALTNASTTAAPGSNLQIDDEFMTVTDASDLNNLAVSRAAGGSTAAAHDVGAEVLIGVDLPEAPPIEPPEGELIFTPAPVYYADLSPNQKLVLARGF